MLKLLKKLILAIFNVDQVKKDLRLDKKTTDNTESESPVLEDPDSDFLKADAESNEEPDDVLLVDPDQSLSNNISTEIVENNKKEEGEKEVDNIVEDTLINMSKSGLIIADALYVRSGPSTEYNIIGCFLKGNSVEIIGQDKNTKWYKVVFNETYGFISNKYVSIFDVVIDYNTDLEYGDGCEELNNQVVDNHICCFKFNTAVITQYYSSTPVGAYGNLTEDSSCAAHNLPYGTLVYIPKLKGIVNNTGLFTVQDTGGHGMDFDIFTQKDIGKINAEVYVVSFGTGPVAWSYTAAIEYYRKRGSVYKYNTAWALYNKMGGCLINFWKYNTDDRTIQTKEWYSPTSIKD